MPNPQNLIPNSERTPNERRKNAQKAGRASGRKRRANKTLREAFHAVQSMPIPKKGGGEETVSDAVALALVKKAISGDLRAIELLWDCVNGKNMQTDSEISAKLPIIDVKIDPPRQPEEDVCSEICTPTATA